MPELMKQMDISDKTLHRMIEEGDLPDFSYGSKMSKKKGWHTAVLERHAMEKYERSPSFKNISNTRQVLTENVGVVSLCRGNATVSTKDTDLNNRNTSKKELGSKKVSKSVRAPSRKSRVSTGFSYSIT